ncbi:hypothetical protein EV182_004513 [Spiromyces aspiralis]|uniref:Uncharacterized protein n=1 Tax=Spiromyces aspiralis TaxID=68401 RepID=A0ACC1HPT8_9FUNG|nr:hypothetical protein EV182_004513 [Spiromyces aspiralis]
MEQTDLDSRVSAVYENAKKSGDLIYYESERHYVESCGIRFEVRLVPGLIRKPDSRPEDTEKKPGFVNPFKPYNPHLHVEDISPTHVLLLNKFCVVPHHSLIVTKEFLRQGDPLGLADFDAVVRVIARLSARSVVFYNSGPESGASQPHKHLQVLPVAGEGAKAVPPVLRKFLAQDSAVGEVASSLGLGFVHYGVRLDPAVMGRLPTRGADDDELDLRVVADTARYLLRTYQQVLGQLARDWPALASSSQGQAGAATNDGVPEGGDGEDPGARSPSGPGVISYNLVVVRECMLAVPRSVHAWNGIGVNSLGPAGLFLAKNTEALNKIRELGPLTILQRIGYAAPPAGAGDSPSA